MTGVPAPAPPPELLKSGLSRRRLLKIAGVGGLLLAGGGAVLHALRGFGAPKEGLRVFDFIEADVVQALCEARFPGPPDCPYSAADVKLLEFVDLYVSGLYEDTQQLFRMLIRTLNLSTVLSHGRTFRYLSVAERREALEDWATSELRVRRAGAQSLSFAVHLGYYEDERVRAALGLTAGCDLSGTPNRPTLWTALGAAKGA
ncbi:MAG: gluconate 2-dehydrogenase subunit 3 family protein [Myxococcota bacterium]